MKEFRYKVDNAAADVPETVWFCWLCRVTFHRCLLSGNECCKNTQRNLKLQRVLVSTCWCCHCTPDKNSDLDELATAAMDAANEKPAEATTREDRVKHKLILNPVRVSFSLFSSE